MRSRFAVTVSSLLVASCAAYGCSSVIGLNSLQRVACLDDCGGTSGTADASAAGNDSAGLGGTAGTGGVLASAGNGSTLGGANGLGGGSSAGAPPQVPGDAGAGGAGGALEEGAVCPGGPVPMATWKEHWFEHTQDLSRVFYDDCAVVYFDPDMSPAAASWLGPFMSSAWAYSLKTYGYMGPEPVYAVFHQGKYLGGHSATFVEESHDFHNVTDGGGSDWTQNYQDFTFSLLGFIVESTAAHSKFGSPAHVLWGNSEWQKFYKYDMYLGLGLNDQAAAAYNSFVASSVSFPRANSFWFRDWFYPLWRDYGHAQVMRNFFGLLEKYYPATAQQMPDMNWGEYVHFMSGAAHTNLKPLATKAFGWPTAYDDQFLKAQTDFPDITY